MAASQDLSDANKAQIARFVTFFKGKRERLLADREAEKNEFKTDRLADDQAIFNKLDVEDLVDAYHAQVVGCVREALEGFINLSAVYVSQVLLQAEQAGVTVDTTDLSAIENQNRVDQIAALVAKGAAPVLAKRTTLPTLQAAPPSPSGGGGLPDPTLAMKLQELEAENAQMRERYQMMQSQVSELLKERSVLAAELEKAGAAAVPTVTERLGDSSQFRELKAIVMKKSEEVKALRQVLLANGLPLPGTAGGVELPPEDD